MLVVSLLVCATNARADVMITCPGQKPERFEYAWEAPCVETCTDGTWQIRTPENSLPCLDSYRRTKRNADGRASGAAGDTNPRFRPLLPVREEAPVSAPSTSKPCLDKLNVAAEQGLITKVNESQREIQVNGSMWRLLDLDTKRGFGAVLNECSPGKAWKVVDNRTGRVLGKEGMFGFKITK